MPSKIKKRALRRALNKWDRTDKDDSLTSFEKGFRMGWDYRAKFDRLFSFSYKRNMKAVITRRINQEEFSVSNKEMLFHIIDSTFPKSKYIRKQIEGKVKR